MPNFADNDNGDLEFIEELDGLSPDSFGCLEVGMKVSIILAKAQLDGSDADLEFCREVVRRLYKLCRTEEQISRFRKWLENRYFEPVEF